MAGRPPGEIEFARPRRATTGRLLVAVLFLAQTLEQKGLVRAPVSALSVVPGAAR